jgi:hypothetical protein
VSDFSGWVAAVLFRLGAPNSTANQRFMNEWHQHEQSPCANNPLNTTLHRFNGGNCIHVSGSTWVQRYPTAADGTNATVATLLETAYTFIVRALKSGDPFSVFYAPSVADALRHWGSTSFATWYLAHLTTAPLPTPPPVTSSTVPTPGTRASKSWRQLLVALDRTIPNDLRAAGRARARILHR